MSTKIMAKCWPLEMRTAQKFVLISLADQANDEGVCWPSVGSVIKRTGLSEASVRRAIKSLEKVGLIRAEREPGKATTYTITPVTVTPLSERHPCHSDRTPLSHRQDTPVTVIPPYIEPSGKRKGTITRKRQFPDGMTLTEERASRLASHLDAEAEWAKFEDYHRAKGSTFADWDAAWRTWCRNAAKFNPEPVTPDAFRGNL